MTPYDKSIRKRFFGMRWVSQQEQTPFRVLNPDGRGTLLFEGRSTLGLAPTAGEFPSRTKSGG